ncbi:hypothetical protein ASG93_02955 [Paenibacillus sp. Soil787]|nr:hypothetical protein ASG93_02955 [Paenibacillus sp. Soil787]
MGVSNAYAFFAFLYGFCLAEIVIVIVIPEFHRGAVFYQLLDNNSWFLLTKQQIFMQQFSRILMLRVPKSFYFEKK